MEIDIDHVAMSVGDIERSVEFHVRVFGAKADGLEKMARAQVADRQHQFRTQPV